MSSTSGEVCELYNGSDIVRAIGRPQLEQLLICEDFFKNTTTEKDCGIHTLQSAVRNNWHAMRAPRGEFPTDPRSGLANSICEVYHSKHALRLPSTVDKAANNNPSAERGNEHLDTGFLGPPNLQLNIPSSVVSHKRQATELVIATIIALALQSALLIFAAITSLDEGTRSVVPSHHEPWGFPCYFCGSVLLFSGMLICSIAIEKSTVEYLWQFQPDPCNRVLVFWLQTSQRVNDQSFNPWVIHGGFKQYILTSSRREDVKKSQSYSSDENSDSADTNSDSAETETIKMRFHRLLEKVFPPSLPTLTVIGAFIGAVGFTVQFIGLRGLPWPCAIFHLLAIFFMACVRAYVRRRLGTLPHAYEAWSKYELDFLAIQLVFGQYFQILKRGEAIKNAKDKFSNLKQTWKIKTAQIIGEYPSEFTANKGVLNCPGAIEEGSLQSSQRLVLVRQRLGELCKWPHTAPRAARALSNAMKRFLKDFWPQGQSIKWTIPSIYYNANNANSSHEDMVTLLLKHEGSNWRVEEDKIKSILSLWVASIQAKNSVQPSIEKEGDWRHLASNTTSETECRMIIGYDDDKSVLRRDMNWWTKRGYSEADVEIENWTSGDDLIIGFTGPAKGTNDPEFRRTIGDPNRRLLTRVSQGDVAEFAAQHLFISFIWAIIDHLPIDFLHQGDLNVQNFVRIQSPGTIDLPSSENSTLGFKLSHVKLTSFTQYAEKEGLGSADDVLSCMIPAFSFKDRLPNEMVINRLFPQEILCHKRREWVGLSPKYINLIQNAESFTTSTTEDRLSVAVVAVTMEYIYLMAYDRSNFHVDLDDTKRKSSGVVGEVKVQINPKYGVDDLEVDDNLKSLIQHVSNERFRGVLNELSHFYKLQKRIERL